MEIIFQNTPAIKLVDFRNLTLNLIKKHGEYNKVLNNCTDFVYSFLAKIYYHMVRIQEHQQNHCYQNKLRNDQVYQKHKNSTTIMGSVVRKYKESSMKLQAEEEVEVWPDGYDDYKSTGQSFAMAQAKIPYIGFIPAIATDIAWNRKQKEKWGTVYLGQSLIGTLSDDSDEEI